MEAIACIISFLSALLTMSKNKMSWVLGFAGTSLLAVHFWGANLYASSILQAVASAQCIYGYFQWRNGRSSEPEEVGWDGLVIGLILTYLIILAVTFVFGGLNIWLDTFVATLGITGGYLMAKRRIEFWFFYGLVDIIGVFYYWSLDMHYVAVQNSFMFFICVAGFRQWAKSMKNHSC